MFDYLNWRICAFLLYLLSHSRASETRPKPAGAGAGAEMHPRVYLRAGFFQPHGFAYERVFIKPAPTSAGAIPKKNQSQLIGRRVLRPRAAWTCLKTTVSTRFRKGDPYAVYAPGRISKRVPSNHC